MEETKTPQITCEAYLKLKDEGKDYVLIDVRTKEEWDDGHIDDAIHIPIGELEEKIGEVVKDKNTLVITHCRSGGRGCRSADKLNELGYNAKNLQEGYLGYCEKVKK